MRSVDRKSPVSTVTSLFMDDGVLGAEEIGNHRNSRPSLYKIRYNDKIYSSASKVLEEYIHHFDEEQTWELAKSLTENCTQTPIKREVRRAKLKSAPSTIEKEIRLARQLLPSSYTDDTCGSDSVDTDDLLTSRSNLESVTTIPFKDQPNYRRNFNSFQKKRFYQPSIHIRDNAD
uniref:Uncharacterized protein n=1 Tax=Ciona savignyi TaxID=51511 RepID=H2Z5B1_CIOSA